MPHRTTLYGGRRGTPWAVSLSMWSNFMRVVDETGVSVRELERRARARPHLSGMQRWGYVVVAADPADGRRRPPRREWLVRPTEAGRRAQAVWRPLPAAIEERWRTRFGEHRVVALRVGLQNLVDQTEIGLPEYLTQSYGGFACVPAADGEASPGRLPLSALMSQVLQAFAIEYERESKLSLQFSANVVRVLDETGVAVREVPRRSGVAIEAIRTALGIMAKRGFVIVQSDPGAGRGSAARLTTKGRESQEIYRRLPNEIEQHWRTRFGARVVDDLRQSLQALVEGTDSERSALWLGLEPPPDTWRAKIRKPDRLPHYPMPRQGGHPDGT
jgi:DNA-binding MarR family transcriptional regulator